MNKDKFQILRDFAKSNEKPDKTIYEYVKEVLDMNSAYAKENQELKKQLEEWERLLINAKEMLEIQGYDGNYNYDSYMLGLYNGMEYIIALFETREPNFKNGKDIEFLNDKNKNQELKKQLEEKNKTKIFVEQNLEEAYGEGLYLEHLENKNQKYKEAIDKAIEYIEQHAITVTDGNITTNKHELLEMLKAVE